MMDSGRPDNRRQSDRGARPDPARRAADSRHPGLQVKKMEGVDDIWEIRVTDNYRITFQFVEGGALLRRVGTHNVLRRP